MSISMHNTKAQMYSEIERLRNEIARLKATEQQPRDAVAETAQHSQPITKQSLAQFCAAYCTTHNVRSVPGHVVQAWRNAQ